MPKLLRAILLILFWIVIIAAFCLAAIILVFMAAGYRYNSKSGEVQKTGMIYLKANPRAVDVYLDQELKSHKTPTRLLYLSPKTYEAKITKPGYIDWQKSISVKSQEVNSYDRIVLFLSQKSKITLQKNISSFILSPNKRYLAFNDLKNQKIQLFNLTNHQSRILYSSKDTVKPLLWSNNSTKLIAKDKIRGYLSIDTRNVEKNFFITEKTGVEFTKLLWNPANADYILGLSKNKIYRIDLTKGTGKIIRQNVADFTCSNYELLYIYQKNNIERLMKTNFSGENLEFLTPPLSFAIKNIFVSKNGRIALTDQENNLYLYLKTDGNYALQKIKDGVFSALWGKVQGVIQNLFGDEKLIYFGANEIGGYFQKRDPRFRTEENNFITRVNAPIQKVIWYDDFEHVAYLAGNKVHVIELDGGNDTILAENVKDFDLINDGKSLLVLDNKGLDLITIRK
jgi:hypothetical protein